MFNFASLFLTCRYPKADFKHHYLRYVYKILSPIVELAFQVYQSKYLRFSYQVHPPKFRDLSSSQYQIHQLFSIFYQSSQTKVPNRVQLLKFLLINHQFEQFFQ